MQHRRGQLLRASRRGVAVEKGLRLGHQATQPLRIGLDQRIHGLMHDALVDGAQQLLHTGLNLVLGERIASVEPVQDLHRVLLRRQIDDDEVQLTLDLQFLRVQPVAVEGHHHGPVAERAALVHAPAARRRRDLAHVGQFHLAAHRQLQIVDAVEGPRRQHADGRAGGQALFHGQIGLEVVDGQPAHVVVGQHLVSDARDIAPEAAGLGGLQQRLRLHGNLGGPDALAVGAGCRQYEGSRVRLHLGVDALVGAGDQGVALFDVGVDAPVAARPVGVLTEQADAAGDEDLHGSPREDTSSARGISARFRDHTTRGRDLAKGRPENPADCERRKVHLDAVLIPGCAFLSPD